MSFSQVLSDYCREVGCTGKQLADASGIAPSTISRYRNGSRRPAPDAPEIGKLADGLSQLAQSLGIEECSDRDEIARSLSAAVNAELHPVEATRFAERFDALATAAGLGNAELSRRLGIDPSYLSRIRGGQRVPPNPKELASQFAEGIMADLRDEEDQVAVAALLGDPAFTPEHLSAELLCAWIMGEPIEPPAIPEPAPQPEAGPKAQPEAQPQAGPAPVSEPSQPVLNPSLIPEIQPAEPEAPRDEPEPDATAAAASLLAQLDALGPSALAPEKARVRRAPIPRRYFGAEGIQAAQLDFLRVAASARGAHEVVLYSDVPPEPEPDAFADQMIAAAWAAVAANKHLSWIFVVPREAALAVEWAERMLPLFLSGQVSAYHLVGHDGRYLQNVLCACEVAALRGECVEGYQDEGSYQLTRKHDEVDYLRLRAYRLLEVATPVLQVFGEGLAPEYELAVLSHEQRAHERRSLLAAPPLATIPYDVLEAMLERSGLDDVQREQVRATASKAYSGLVELCARGSVADTVCGVRADGTSDADVRVMQADLLSGTGVTYTADELASHVQATRYFSESYPTYRCEFREGRTYDDVEVVGYPGEAVVVTKRANPQVHVVVEHPLLRDALLALA